MKVIYVTILFFALICLASMAFSETNDNQSLDNYVQQVKQNRDDYAGKKADVKTETNTGLEAVQQKPSETTTGDESEGYIVVPFELSFIPTISTSGMLGKKVINNVAINILASYSAKLKGFEAGIINLKSEEVAGFQGAAVLNYSGGNLYGFQGAGVANIALGEVQGVQSGAVFNFAGNVIGAQFGVINFSEKSSWAQVGTINLSGSITGAQFGVINLSKTVEGAQFSTINICKEFEGAQIGVINTSAGKSKGTQIGVINYSDDLDGAAIGLISIVKNGPVHPFVTYDDAGFVTAGVKHGTKTIYNIYAAGIDTSFKTYKATLGIGYHIDLAPVSINMDITASSVNSTSAGFGQYPALLSSLRIGAGYQMIEHLTLVAGVSLNYFNNFNGSAIAEPTHGYYFPVGNDKNRFWPGFYAGLEF